MGHQQKTNSKNEKFPDTTTNEKLESIFAAIEP